MSDASSTGNREDTVQDRGQPDRQRASVSGMRILLVVNGTDFGGTEINVSRIAVTLRKRGHHVCVLSLKRLGPVGRQIAQTGIAVCSLEMGESVALRGVVRGTAVLAQWLTRVKGHVYLIRALARLARDVPDVHVVLVGDGPEDRRLRSEANAHGVESRVRFLGSRADAIGIMKSTDVFVLPSLEEGLPVVLLEAMACSLPIVASNVGGVGELIKHGETGLLVAPAEMWNRRASLREGPPLSPDEGVAALARAVSTLLRDRRPARLLGANARRLVGSSHTIEQQVASREQLYAALVNGYNGGASANLTRGTESLQQREVREVENRELASRAST